MKETTPKRTNQRDKTCSTIIYTYVIRPRKHIITHTHTKLNKSLIRSTTEPRDRETAHHSFSEKQKEIDSLHSTLHVTTIDIDR